MAHYNQGTQLSKTLWRETRAHSMAYLLKLFLDKIKNITIQLAAMASPATTKMMPAAWPAFSLHSMTVTLVSFLGSSGIPAPGMPRDKVLLRWYETMTPWVARRAQSLLEISKRMKEDALVGNSDNKVLLKWVMFIIKVHCSNLQCKIIWPESSVGTFQHFKHLDSGYLCTTKLCSR